MGPVMGIAARQGDEDIIQLRSRQSVETETNIPDSDDWLINVQQWQRNRWHWTGFRKLEEAKWGGVRLVGFNKHGGSQSHGSTKETSGPRTYLGSSMIDLSCHVNDHPINPWILWLLFYVFYLASQTLTSFLYSLYSNRHQYLRSDWAIYGG